MGFRRKHSIPDLGVGVGFRVPHYPHILTSHPEMDWFEVISENFMVRGGMPLANLDRLTSHYRAVPHGVSLSIGGPAPLDLADVLDQTAQGQLADRGALPGLLVGQVTGGVAEEVPCLAEHRQQVGPLAGDGGAPA